MTNTEVGDVTSIPGLGTYSSHVGKIDDGNERIGPMVCQASVSFVVLTLVLLARVICEGN